MNEYREQLTELASTFLGLTPEGRREFITKFAETNPECADWLSIFYQYRNLGENT
jgi:phage terminase small subunit